MEAKDDLFEDPSFVDDPSYHHGSVYMVTGANSCVGYEIARLNRPEGEEGKDRKKERRKEREKERRGRRERKGGGVYGQFAARCSPLAARRSRPGPT